MMMTCLIGVAVLIASAALSGPAAVWADAPKPKTDTASMAAQAAADGRHFPVSLKCIISSRDSNQPRGSLTREHDTRVTVASQSSEILFVRAREEKYSPTPASRPKRSVVRWRVLIVYFV